MAGRPGGLFLGSGACGLGLGPGGQLSGGSKTESGLDLAILGLSWCVLSWVAIRHLGVHSIDESSGTGMETVGVNLVGVTSRFRNGLARDWLMVLGY